MRAVCILTLHSLLTSDPLFYSKKRLKAAEAESKLKQVYIPN